MRRFLILLLLFGAFIETRAQSGTKDYIEKNRLNFLREYFEFLSIPNVSADLPNIEKNALFIKNMLQKRGVNAELLTVEGASPVVYGEVKTPGATKTIIFYAHYDGQPVNPNNWAKGLSPFQPQLLSDRIDRDGKFIQPPGNISELNDNWRLYARGSSDDKAGVYAIIVGYEALIKTNLNPSINIKFFFEGEEEVGSTNLERILQQHKDKLRADLWIICDGPRHVSGRKQVVFGVRGDVNVEVKTYGASRPLHSGNYGNWAPNAAQRLVHLLGSMKDSTGHVLIKGFYDDVLPLSASEKKAIAEVPQIEQQLKQELKLAKPDGNEKPFLELLYMPTLNINGMQSANVGELAANIIPSTATAELDLRLVPGNDVKRQVEKLEAHIRSQGYYITRNEPTDEERNKYPLIAKVNMVGTSYIAQRTPMDLPIAQVVIKQVQSTSDEKIVLLPSLGGSLPLYLFEKVLNTKPITITIVNYDNNQHAENENVILKYMWEGIEVMSAIMAGKY